jgi:hypothetical protein
MGRRESACKRRTKSILAVFAAWKSVPNKVFTPLSVLTGPEVLHWQSLEIGKKWVHVSLKMFFRTCSSALIPRKDNTGKAMPGEVTPRYTNTPYV